MRLSPQINLVDVTVVAEKQRLAAIGDEDESVIDKRHRGLLQCASN
jgi:hypothetical protein